MKIKASTSALAVLQLVITTPIAAAAPFQHKPLDGLPPIADGQLYDDDWNHDHQNAASERFSAVLRKKFPPGSSESELTQVLQQQGFKYPPPAQPGCIDPKKIMPVGVTYVPCPNYDPKHLLKYIWAPHELPVSMWALCSQTIGVIWTANEGKLTSIQGFYGGDCV